MRDCDAGARGGGGGDGSRLSRGQEDCLDGHCRDAGYAAWLVLVLVLVLGWGQERCTCGESGAEDSGCLRGFDAVVGHFGM